MDDERWTPKLSSSSPKWLRWPKTTSEYPLPKDALWQVWFNSASNADYQVSYFKYYYAFIKDLAFYPVMFCAKFDSNWPCGCGD